MKTIDSKFRLVLLAAKRAEQIIQGSKPKIKTFHTKPTYIALEEIKKGTLEYLYKNTKGETIEVKETKKWTLH